MLQQHQIRVMDSWRQCVQMGVNTNINNNLYPLSQEDLSCLQEEYQSVISLFEQLIRPLETYIPHHASFLLCSNDGTLLKKFQSAPAFPT